MAFSISSKTLPNGKRNHSTIHVATSRDYDRKKFAEKQEIKLEREHDELERKMMAHAKWNQRADNNNVRQSSTNANINSNQDRATVSLDDYLQRERIKQDNMINSKRMGNERIRRPSINNIPKT